MVRYADGSREIFNPFPNQLVIALVDLSSNVALTQLSFSLNHIIWLLIHTNFFAVACSKAFTIARSEAFAVTHIEAFSILDVVEIWRLPYK